MSLFLTQLAADNFQRANENPLKSPPWSTGFGLSGLQIVSNLCEATITGTCAENYTGTTLPADQYASTTIGSIAANGSDVFLFVRVTGSFLSGNYYEMLIQKGNVT